MQGSYFAVILCHLLIPKTIHKLLSGEDTKLPTSSMATARTETTRGPTHSIVRVTGTSAWQKCFICRCHYLHCNFKVAGVLSFDDFLVCLVCKSKVQPADDKSGTCTSRINVPEGKPLQVSSTSKTSAYLPWRKLHHTEHIRWPPQADLLPRISKWRQASSSFPLQLHLQQPNYQ